MELICVKTRSRCWSLTINNPTKEDITQLHTVFEICADFACQEEIGEKSGTPHIQGYIYFKYDKSESVVRKLIPRGHWEKARKAVALKRYCTKAKTQHGRIWRKTISSRVLSPAGKPTEEAFMLAALTWFKERYDV